MYRRIATFLLVAVLLIFAVFTAVFAQFTPDVFVLEQPVVDGKVKISRAVINGPGWIVIHTDSGGEIGVPIGQAPLTSGINAQVSVAVDADAVTDVLYAMLHVDAGEVGTFEFPDGPDIPVLVNDAAIAPSFAIRGIENTVVGTAINADGFDTLVAAIETAGLVETLQGAGPFTVFAPTDEAFAVLPDGELEALLADTDALNNLLMHHVVADKMLSGDLEDGLALASLQGAPLTITIDADGASVNDASIVVADLEAFNGVVHVIDTVLLLPTDDTGEGDTSEGDTGEGGADEGQFGDIVETAIAVGSFETLVTAIQAADLMETLKSDGPFTLLAPTDDAFAALPPDKLAALLAAPDELADLLLYHVLPGTALSTDLVDGLEVETAQGSFVTFAVSDGAVSDGAVSDGTATVNGANIVLADILASNGVIHVIDAVILPPSSGDESTDGGGDESIEGGDGDNAANDIVSLAADTEDFSTLTAAITAAGLSVTLQGEGPFTLFAPTNAAFDKLPAETLEALLADRDALIDILFYHTISGNLLASGISDDLNVTTLQGTDITFGVSSDGVMVNDANIVIADIAASNGIIHAVDIVLSPAGDGLPDPTPVLPTAVPPTAIPATPVPATPAPTPVPATPAPTPDVPSTMPETGASFGSFGSTLSVVSLVLLALVGIAILERKQQ